MAIRAVLIGVLTAVICWFGHAIWAELPKEWVQYPLASLMIGAVASLSIWAAQKRRKARRKSQDIFDRSLVDILLHIHRPRGSLSPRLWLRRGGISFLLSIFGGRAGPEGPAIELAQAVAILTRPRSSHWLETQRRTDSSMVLASGLAAAFGTPFAATLLPIEMGLGGSALPGALAATVATVMIHYLGITETYSWPGLQMWTGWRDGIAIFGVTVAAAVLGAAIVKFIAWARDSSRALVGRHVWALPLIGGVLLTVVSLSYQSEITRSPEFVQILLSQPYSPLDAGLLVLSQFLALAIAVACFGTTGIIWPLFALGCVLGYGMEPVFPGYPRTSMVAGGAALLGVTLGTPISGALLAFELTGQWTVIVPCLVTGFAALRLRQWFKVPSLISNELAAAQIEFEEGRLKSVLSSLYVKDAMVTNHVTARDNDTVPTLQSILQNSPYPFVAVVSGSGAFVGILSADEVAEAAERAQANPSSKVSFGVIDPLIRDFMEARDIVLRSGQTPTVVRQDDRLSSLTGIFQNTPVVPVLGDQDKVLGLLFVHEVRIAYDRELAKRSFLHQKGGSE